MSEINYDDKVDLIVDTEIDDIFKVTASDMNQIKNAVNDNATNIATLETDKLDKESVVNEPSTETDEVYSSDYLNDKLVSVGTEAPTDGERVWFEKGKNLFDGQLELGMYDETGAKATNNTNYRNVEPINVQPSTTYTFSINGTSQKYVVYLYKKDGTFIRVNTLTSGTFTTPAETYLLNFRCFNADFTSDYANLKVQLEQGSTATTYEAYVSPSINVDEEEWYSKPKVLWTNPNPANNFASQLVTLADNLSNYKYYEVIYRHHKSLNIYSSTGKVLSSEFALLMSSRYINATREVTSIGTGTITFSYSTDFLTYGSTTPTNNNDRNIPIQILGYKG